MGIESFKSGMKRKSAARWARFALNSAGALFYLTAALAAIALGQVAIGH